MATPKGQREILVVDDDDDVREILQRELEAAGFATSGAANGAEALDRVARKRPTLVLLDMVMPVMTGEQFVEAIHRDERLRDLPVVVITAWPREARRLPVREVLTKPLEMQTLLDSVNAALA